MAVSRPVSRGKVVEKALCEMVIIVDTGMMTISVSGLQG